ncbi:hypothetical protein QBC42DRAFT_349992 [Cladorrhinum samala]|uniref:Uncharacterized protein n=1 Tax=Cladorrhinum samala TaxID=585594 RepID=A0AAV9HD54_9PEZI|nr:hypothetical protein QBC42DRAFT_349992 [Cladorrhinum samala]
MNRQVLQAALGRASASTNECVHSPTSWGTISRPFSTSVSNYFQDSRNYNEGDKPPSRPDGGRQQRSQFAAQRLANLASRPRSAPGSIPRPASGAGAQPFLRRPGEPLKSGEREPLGGPKILSLRSLRGSFGGHARGGVQRGPLDGPRGGSGLGIASRPAFAGAGGRIAGGFRGRGRGGGSGSGRRGAGRGGGRGGARAERAKKKKKDDFADVDGKLKWNEEEQAVFDRIEQGEVVPFVPKLTPDNLSGYGPALATDAQVGKVETVLRTMRMISGGQAFNSDSGVTVDAKAMRRRYHHEKKPVFFNSKAEKEWAERAEPNWSVRAPSEETKKALLDLSVLGLYQDTKPAGITDVKGMMVNYHGRTWSYRTEDSKKFVDKVLSILPAEAKPAAAPQAKKTA